MRNRYEYKMQTEKEMLGVRRSAVHSKYYCTSRFDGTNDETFRLEGQLTASLVKGQITTERKKKQKVCKRKDNNCRTESDQSGDREGKTTATEESKRDSFDRSELG
jgi:hypothetical protein